MKKYLFVFVLLPILCQAKDRIEVDGLYYFLNDDFTAEVTYEDDFHVQSTLKGDIVIPESIIVENVTYRVTEIGKYAFFRCYQIKSIEMPNSITYIGELAFGYNYYNLEKIKLSSALTKIDENAFEYCYNLKEIDLPESLTEIGDNAFLFCYSLEVINIPSSVCHIGTQCFGACINLTEINVDSENQSYCSNDGVLFTKDKKELIAFPSGRSGEYEIPDGTITIKEYSFRGGISPIQLKLPQSIETIEIGAFYKCLGLESIEISEGLNYIDTEAFYGCTALQTVSCHAIIPPECSPWAFTYSNFKECVLYVPQNSIDAYSTTYPWSEFGTIKEIKGNDASIESILDKVSEFKVYSINGILLLEHATKDDLNGLPKGCYIINNKKVFIN